MEYAALKDEVAEAAGRVAALLRRAGADQPVTGSEWSVGELGAHLVDVADRNLAIAKDSPPPTPDLTEAGAMARYNAGRLEGEFTERDPSALADALEEANAALLDALGPDGERVLPWYAAPSSAREVLGVWLGELLIHGLDLARTEGAGWPISAAQAAAVFDGLVPGLPLFARPDTVAAFGDATVHVRMRGAGSYTVRTHGDGRLEVERGKPDSADLHVSASPVAYLMVGYGRSSQWGTIAKGQITAWGRKPWLALRFGQLFANP